MADERPVTREWHASHEAHRMGIEIPFGTEPEPVTPGFSQVGSGERPASSDHKHNFALHVTDTAIADIADELRVIVPGVMFINDTSKRLWINFSDGWYFFDSDGGPF